MKQNTIIRLKDLSAKEELDAINALWSAIMKMDAHLIYSLLDDDRTYEDVSKKDFVELLNDRFNVHRSLGDSELFLDLDICKSCNCDQPVSKFIGNTSGKHFALYFEIKDGEITDIYNCVRYGMNLKGRF